MTNSDAARLTPYELVFTEGEFESRLFPRIEAEALDQVVDARQPERFDFLSTAGDVIREVTPDEAPPEALEQYRALLFHAYHFWRGGRRLYMVDVPVARYLVEAAPNLDDWAFEVEAPSAYVQLPSNLFWSSIAPDTPPEPVDGFFFTTSEGTDRLGDPFSRLEVLLVLGIRRSRAGFSVISLSTSPGPKSESVWGGEARPEGDFANTLPGGEISGLYSMLTTGEVLKLVGRILWYMDQFPDAQVEVVAEEPTGEIEAPTSRLDYVRLTLGATGGGDERASE